MSDFVHFIEIWCSFIKYRRTSELSNSVIESVVLNENYFHCSLSQFHLFTFNVAFRKSQLLKKVIINKDSCFRFYSPFEFLSSAETQRKKCFQA